MWASGIYRVPILFACSSHFGDSLTSHNNIQSQAASANNLTFNTTSSQINYELL